MSREEALRYYERTADDPMVGYVSVDDLKGMTNTIYDDLSYPVPMVNDASALPSPGQEGMIFFLASTGDIVVFSQGGWRVNTQGAPGPTGPQGPTGVTGPSGPTGPTGPGGSVGPAGPQGVVGPEGPRGLTGLAGAGVNVLGTITNSQQPSSVPPAGSMYIVGAAGCSIIMGTPIAPASPGDGLVWSGTAWSNVGPVRGPQGVQGTVGPQGPQGAAGVTGATGPQGPTGLQGIPGIQGTSGPPGAKGDSGVKGDAGLQGASIQGPQGVKGDTGAVGPAGTAGAQGPKGDVGNTGPQGQGLAIAAATAIEPPSPTAGAVYLYSGTAITTWGSVSHTTIWPNDLVSSPSPGSWVNLGALRGPQGLTGPQGATGPQGPGGPTGTTGSTGATGPIGPVGPTGSQGMQGVVGPQGLKGDPGTPGATGAASTVAGPTGPAGATGATGAQGPQGIPGVGTQGPAGPQGVKGDTGTAGTAGATGATGAPGAKGDTGATGSTGLQGPKGDKGDQGTGLAIQATISTQGEITTYTAAANLDGKLYNVITAGLSFPGIVTPPVPGDLVIKIGGAGGSWANQGQNKGPTGPQGIQGPVGPAMALSTDANQGAKTGTDGKLWVADTAKTISAGAGLTGGGSMTGNVTLAVVTGPGIQIATNAVGVVFGTASNTVARGDHTHPTDAKLDGSSPFTGAVSIDAGVASTLTLKGSSSGGARVKLDADGGASLVSIPLGAAIKDGNFSGLKNLEVAAPTANAHAATKKYVDDRIIAQAAQPAGVEGLVWVQV